MFGWISLHQQLRLRPNTDIYCLSRFDTASTFLIKPIVDGVGYG